MALDPAWYPHLASEGYSLESDATNAYNCVAWAAGNNTQWWEPRAGYYWPPGVPKKFTVAALMRLFEQFGYQICDNGQLEDGYDKVAIYALRRKAKHVARQLPNGKWTSKCGGDIDIEHPLRGLEGPRYGAVVRVLKRQRE